MSQPLELVDGVVIGLLIPRALLLDGRGSLVARLVDDRRSGFDKHLAQLFFLASVGVVRPQARLRLYVCDFSTG